MKRLVLFVLAGVSLAVMGGCASTTYEGTRDKQAAPTYTQEEKENMTDESSYSS